MQKTKIYASAKTGMVITQYPDGTVVNMGNLPIKSISRLCECFNYELGVF